MAVQKVFHARNREPEIGIELVGDAEGVGLKAQAKQSPVAVEGVPRVEDREVLELSAVSVTLRKRSDCVPTSPRTQLAGPLTCTVSTRIGSLKSEPVRIWPMAIGNLQVMLCAR
jgi:hypothetical protein